MIALIEKLFGSAPALMGDITSWLILLAAVVVLGVVAFFLPKGELAKKITGICLMVGIVALLVVPVIVNPAIADNVWGQGFTTYMLVIVALVLLYGILCGKSNLAQALYGIVVSIALPMGLLRLLVPTWTTAKSIMDITSSTADLVTLLIYSILFFVSVWLVFSGTYRIRLTSMWHILYGFIIFGSVMVFTTEAGLSFSYTAIQMLRFFGTEGLNWAKVGDIAILCGMALGVIVIISLIATLWRKYVSKSGEKVIASETKKALLLRVVGKVVAVAASGAALVFMPKLVGADITNFTTYEAVKAELVGFPAALAFLAPIVILAVVLLVFEFLAEDHEIKVAQAAYEAETSAE